MRIPSNNLTWSNGLINTVNLGRGQRVQVSHNQAIELIICKMQDSNGLLDPANLSPQMVLKPGTNHFQMPLVGVGSYCGIAVKMSSQTVELQLKLRTNQAVEGYVIARVTYRVMDSITVLQRNDVLKELQMEAQRIAQHSVNGHTYEQLHHTAIELDLSRLTVPFLGLRIERVIVPNPIEWPSELMKHLRVVVDERSSGRLEQEQDRIQMQNQRNRNDLIMQELARLNIVHPEVVMYVLANYEKHNRNVMQAVQEAHRNLRTLSREEQEEARKRLDYLIEKGLVDRTQLEDVINHSIDGSISGPQTPRQLPQSGSMPQIPYVQQPYEIHNPNDTYNAPQQLGGGQPRQLPDSNHTNQTQMNPTYNSEQPSGAMYGKEACGQASEGRLVMNGTQEFILCADGTNIGRSRNNHIMVMDGSVSRQHCQILRRMPGHFVIMNKKSGITTLINNRPLQTEVQLQPGDQIRLGNVVFVFQLENTQPPTGFSEDETRL